VLSMFRTRHSGAIQLASGCCVVNHLRPSLLRPHRACAPWNSRPSPFAVRAGPPPGVRAERGERAYWGLARWITLTNCVFAL
jgi:hypothetical protein